MLIAAAAAMTLVSCGNEESTDPQDSKKDSKDDTVAVTGVTLDKTSLSFTIGDAAVTLTATVAPENATDKTVSWASSKEAVATVKDGVVTPVGEGAAVITATCGEKSATCNVTVAAAAVAVTGISLSATELTVAIGGTEDLQCFIEPEDADKPIVDWESDDTEVATVDECTITGINAGTCVITATSLDGGFTASCTVTVEAARIVLTAESIYTSAPMQYVGFLNGYDDDGMGGSPDWCASYAHEGGDTETILANREAHYGLAENMWDEDPSTCFSTNTDFWVLNTTWGAPSDRCIAYHYIDVNFDTPAKEISLYIQNPAKYVYFFNDNGFKIYVSADGDSFEMYNTYFTEGGLGDSNGANAEITIESIASDAGIRAIRFDANGKSKAGEDNSWTGNGAAFGIAELKIWRLK